MSPRPYVPTTEHGKKMRDINTDKKSKRQYWGELELIYDAAAQALLSTVHSTNNIVTHPDVAGKLKDDTEATTLVIGFSKDALALSKMLTTIHNRHAHKRGVVRSQDDQILNLAVFQQYVSFNELFAATSLPVVLSIQEFAVTATLDARGANDNALLADDAIEELTGLSDMPSEPVDMNVGSGINFKDRPCGLGMSSEDIIDVIPEPVVAHI